MATFLTTTGVSYELEELIRGADERLVLISPFLRVNQRIRDLLADKDRLKIDTRVVYGKSELSSERANGCRPRRRYGRATARTFTPSVT